MEEVAGVTTTANAPTPSAYRNTHLADRIRTWLHDYLGNECAECGATSPLEIDHPWGRSWSPRKLCRYRRWLRYRKEALAGQVRLLCADCNKAPECRPRKPVHGEDTPF